MITNTAFRPLFLLLGTVLVLGACASLTDVEMIYIEIATDRTEYALGDTVILSVTNRGTEPVGIDASLFCTFVQRASSDGEWIDVTDPRDCSVFSMIRHTAPGATFTVSRWVVPEVFEVGGIYRWAWNVREQGRPYVRDWHSNPVQVVTRE
jgi:hypothetical protein